MPIIQTKRGKIYTFTPEADGEVEVDNLLDPELPSGYTRLAYLESTGSQHLETDVYIQTNCDLVIDWQRAHSAPNWFEIIHNNAPAGRRIRWGAYEADNPVRTWAYLKSFVGDVRFPVASHLDRMYTQIQGNSVLINGLTCTLGRNNFPPPYTPPDEPISLFTGYLRGGVREKARVWKCIVWDGGEKVIDLVPALDVTGRPCMYNRVSNKPYYNTESGEFIAGIESLAQLYSLLTKLPDLTEQTQGTLTIRLDASLQTDELRAMIDEKAAAKNWEITEAA